MKSTEIYKNNKETIETNKENIKRIKKFWIMPGYNGKQSLNLIQVREYLTNFNKVL